MMNFEKVMDEIKELQTQVENNKIDTRFEKNKLKDYLGKSLYNKLKRYNAIIAGGMITSLFTRNEIHDVDVYFRRPEDLAAFVEEIWGSYIASHTKKATMFVTRNRNIGKDIYVQVIHFKYFQTPQEVFDTFDFTHVMGAYDFAIEDFILHKDFLKHNAQRILKFNKNTAFPLISLIRSNKYMDRGYSISKPELMRIILTCMNLEINSYDELKEHLGGMYGESYDKVFENVKDEEFNLEEAINRLQNLSLDEDYFKQSEPVKFDNQDDFIETVCQLPVKWFMFKDKKYRVRFDGTINIFSGKPKDDWEKVNAKDYLDFGKVYKFVKKKDGKYYSFYDSSFEYVIGEEVVHENENHGLYFNRKHEIDNSTYFSRDSKALIEVEVSFDDLINFDSHVIYSKAKVIREVPEEEWQEWI